MTSRCRWARRLFATGVLACVIGLMPATAAAQTVTLAWDPVPDPSVAGYLLYIGTQSGVYTETQDVGNRTTFVYTIGQPSRTHYFAVAAYAADRLPGIRSAEVSWAAAGGTTSTPGSGSAPGRVPPASERGCSASDPCVVGADTLRTSGVIGALAPAVDGRVFVVEDDRRVRVATAEGWRPSPALTIEGDFTIDGIALDPSFARNHYVYITRIATGPDGRRELDIVRYREVNDVLGEAAVVVPGVRLPAEGNAPFTVDASGSIYVAVPGVPGRSDNPYAATVLKYHHDGSVPAGNRAMSPVFAEALADPVSVMADGRGELWMTAVDASGAVLARLALTGDASRPRIPTASRFGDTSVRPVGTASVPLDDAGAQQMYVATTKTLYRFTSGSAEAAAIQLPATAGDLRVIAAAPGVLYLAVGEGDGSPASQLLVVRLQKVN